MNKKTNNQGYTLMEVMIVLAISSILAYIAAPTLSTLLSNNKMTTLNNGLLTALNFTRNSAITYGKSVTLCKSNATSTGCSASTAWGDGWIIFHDDDQNGVVGTGETILSVYQELNSKINLSYGHNYLVYNSEGFSSGYSGTFLLCDSRGDSAKRGITIATNGRPRKADASELIANSCPSP